MQCHNDIGLIADLENHFCFDGKSISITSDGSAYIDPTTTSEFNNNGADGGSSKAINWSKESVLKLIEVWKIRSSADKGKSLWTSLADELKTPTFQPSWEQVENKWKGLRRTHKKIKDNNNSSGCIFIK